MDSVNRLQHLSAVPTLNRQTPKRDFGDELVHVAGQGARLGVGIMGGVISTPPVVSAAVAAASGVVNAATSSGSSALRVGVTSPPNPPVPASAPTQGALGAGGASDTLAQQAALNRESQAFSAMYLQLQSEMQAESRQYNAVSNVIKVRHDSAKSAINNIR